MIGEYVRLKKTGQNFTGLCPFHQEKTPSFAVHPVKQIYHCFGCGAGGDVFKFVMEMDKSDFPEAVRTVAEKCGIAIPQPRERSPEERRENQQRTGAGRNASRGRGVFRAPASRSRRRESGRAPIWKIAASTAKRSRASAWAIAPSAATRCCAT